MQDGEESDLCAQVFRICGNFQQGLGTGLEQQVEEDGLAGECQWVQFMGHGEDDVEVVGVEQIALLRLDPSLASLRLALGTATRSAGVIGDGCFVLAVVTLVLMPAEGRGAATLRQPEMPSAADS